MVGYQKITKGFKNYTSKLQLTVTRYADEGVLNLHFHSHAELIHVTCGSIEIKVNFQSITIKENEFLLIMPEMLHEISYGSIVDFWVKELTKDGLEKFFNSSFVKDLAYVRFSCDRLTEMRYCNTCLQPQRVLNYRLIEGHSPIDELDNLLYSEYCCVIKDVMDYSLSEGDAKYVANDSEKFICDILKYISEHINEHISAITYAEHIGVTDFGIRRKLKALLCKNGYAYTFTDLVNIRRIELAKRLLKHTDLTIKQIAKDSGLLIGSRMNALFFKYEGVRPTHYRETLRLLYKM